MSIKIEKSEALPTRYLITADILHKKQAQLLQLFQVILEFHFDRPTDVIFFATYGNIFKMNSEGHLPTYCYTYSMWFDLPRLLFYQRIIGHFLPILFTLFAYILLLSPFARTLSQTLDSMYPLFHKHTHTRTKDRYRALTRIKDGYRTSSFLSPHTHKALAFFF